jgi:surface antigen
VGPLIAACAAPAPQSDELATRDAFYRALTAAETVLARQAVQEALEIRLSNDIHRWESASGGQGSVMPIRTFRIKTGHYCRDYTETLTKNGERASVDRTACRDGEGMWRVTKP